MRMTLKHQILLTPAVILFLLTLLLGFLQYTYWDLSVKRQEARDLKSAFIAIAEADIALQRIHALTMLLNQTTALDVKTLEDFEDLHIHLEGAFQRIFSFIQVGEAERSIVWEALADLDPAAGFDPTRFQVALTHLRPELKTLSETTQKQRERVRDVHVQDIDAIVERTAFVSIVVLGLSILVGIALSLVLARGLLKRIQRISENAGKIANGDLTPLPPPEAVHDELDDLTLSINHMTEKLIRVVATEKILEGAEEERKRIAMDLHDQTLSDLSSVLRGIQSLKEEVQTKSEAESIEKDLQRAISNLRGVMEDLHPHTLDILGLGAAVESYLDRNMNRENLPQYHFHMAADADIALPPHCRLGLYRILIEGIQNVIKHSKASRYEVCIDRRGEELVLSVEDNGVGFDFDGSGRAGGRGLNNIRERGRAIGTNVQWKPSRFTSGTRLEIVMPLKTEPS